MTKLSFIGNYSQIIPKSDHPKVNLQKPIPEIIPSSLGSRMLPWERPSCLVQITVIPWGCKGNSHCQS